MGRCGGFLHKICRQARFNVLQLVIGAAFAITVGSLHRGMLSSKVFFSKNRLVSVTTTLSLGYSMARMASLIASNDMSRRNILALDFDGVVCASSVESSFSSILAAQNFWPGACQIMKVRDPLSSYSAIDLEAKDSAFCKVRSAVNELRPIVETGFENMLLVRAIYEEIQLTGEP